VGYSLDDDQLALVAAAVPGHAEVFCIELEGERRAWSATVREDLYDRLLALKWENAVESCLVARDGSWGLMFSYVGHAVLAGEAPLVEAISASLPQFQDAAIIEMTRDWWLQGGYRARRGDQWLRTLLEHVYGPDRSADLLRQAGVPE
jgi:hypothetical protein